jgi:hypothetical protein
MAGTASGGAVEQGGTAGNLADQTMAGGGATAGGGSAALGGQASGGDAGSGGAPARAFVHPGILENQATLDFVKAKIGASAEPWKSALAKAKASKFGQSGYTPHPRAVVECGPVSNPDLGCTDEKDDSMAAYTHALLWAYTGDEASAKKAIEIMNAWSAVITDHTNSNAPLQSAWAAEVFPRAAEIIRYTYSGWAETDVAQFGKMLHDVYLPQVVNGSGANGNWETSMIEATLNIAIFNDDWASFDHGVAMWHQRVPAYIYANGDGATPVPPPRGNKTGAALTKYWYDQSVMMVGLAQETCRDLGHVQYGLAGIINAAETARLQGVDLYGSEAARLRAGLEFHAKFLNGAAVPANLCGGTLSAVTPDPMWEIALNHFVGRRGETLPETQTLVNKIRPTGADHHMGWETLTHAGTGAGGL